MQILIDEQLPAKLATSLMSIGVNAIHVDNIGLGGAKDIEIAKYAIENNCILMTKDSDFISRANLGKFSPQVIWIRIGNATHSNLWGKLEPLLPKIFQQLQAGEQIIEII